MKFLTKNYRVEEELKKDYIKMVKLLHPDNNGHQVKMATHLLKKYIKLLIDKLADEIISSAEEYNNIEWG